MSAPTFELLAARALGTMAPMIERNPAVVIVLMFVTCGFYWYYYMHVTTKELTEATGRSDINAGTELLLNLVTCGVFGMYSAYRNQQIIDEWYASRGVQHEAKAQLVGLMNLLTFVLGATWIVASFVHQDELNKLIAQQAGKGASSPAPMTF